MIDAFLARVREPRFGVVLLTCVVNILMSMHWAPLMVPGLAVLALAVLRPRDVVRPVVWWLMAAMWFAALLLLQERMEDHVYLYSVWLVALAMLLGGDEEGFVERAAWQARVLIGVTFGFAVAWKLYFNEYVSGAALWVFFVVDRRFEPLVMGLGVPDATLEQGRAAVSEILSGSGAGGTYVVPADVAWRVTVVAVLTLLLETTIAVSHLAPDASRLAVLRLPSLVLFGVATYSVVPVIPFAALLATLTLVVARWRSGAMWVFPVLVIPAVIRLVVLQQ